VANEPRIVAAVMTATDVREGMKRNPVLAKALEQAQTDAIMQAIAQGVSMDDVEEIKRRKKVAREECKDSYYASLAEFQKQRAIEEAKEALKRAEAL